MRQHPELDLGVIGRDEHVAGLGHERAADLASELCPDRDVLKVWIAAAQAAGCGDGLIEARVDATGLGIDQLRQRIDVGALQLLKRAPFETEPWKNVPERQLPQYLDRRRSRLGFCVSLQGRELQLVEENRGQLLG